MSEIKIRQAAVMFRRIPTGRTDGRKPYSLGLTKELKCDPQMRYRFVVTRTSSIHRSYVTCSVIWNFVKKGKVNSSVPLVLKIKMDRYLGLSVKILCYWKRILGEACHAGKWKKTHFVPLKSHLNFCYFFNSICNNNKLVAHHLFYRVKVYIQSSILYFKCILCEPRDGAFWNGETH